MSHERMKIYAALNLANWFIDGIIHGKNYTLFSDMVYSNVAIKIVVAFMTACRYQLNCGVFVCRKLYFEIILSAK